MVSLIGSKCGGAMNGTDGKAGRDGTHKIPTELCVYWRLRKTSEIDYQAEYIFCSNSQFWNTNSL